MCAAEFGLRAVQHDPATLDSMGEKGRILVFGLPDDAKALDRREVPGGCEIDRRPRRAVGGAGDDPARQLGDPHGTRVLESPLLARDVVGGSEQRLRVDGPPVGAVGGAGDGEVRDPAEVFDPCKEDGLAVERGGGGVEDGIDRIRPVLRGQNRVVGVTLEKLSLGHVARAGSRTEVGTPAASSMSAARWNASVDSAPSLAFISSVPSPSLQPPVAKS